MGKNNGGLWIPAWQLHDRDPTLIQWKAVYNNMYGGMLRKANMSRLHVFPGEEVGLITTWGSPKVMDRVQITN